MNTSLARCITLGATAFMLLQATAISFAADSAPKKESAPKTETKNESVKDKIKKKLETRPGPATGAVRG